MVVIVLVSVCWNDVHDVCQKSSQIVCCLNHYPSDELRFQLGGRERVVWGRRPLGLDQWCEYWLNPFRRSYRGCR
jgi:hypothetical protein